MMLEAKNLSIAFGGLKAVDGFNLQIEKGQLYGLIGPNGAGKTTVFNLLTGVYTPDTDSITLDGNNIVGKKTIEINCPFNILSQYIETNTGFTLTKHDIDISGICNECKNKN